MLHLLRQNHNVFADSYYLACTHELDDVLLLEDSVFLATKSDSAILRLLEHISGIYVLESDCKDRGILDQVIHNITIVDFKGFVELTEKHAYTVNWS